MKLPIRCPTCGDPLETQYEGVYTIIKKCARHINHRIEIKARQEDDEIYQISVLLPGLPVRWAIWHVIVRELVIHKVDKKVNDVEGSPLPYFEPDLSNYPKLTNKLITYLVFS